MSESTDFCLKDYLRTLTWDIKNIGERHSIAHFCGVGTDTVRSWYNGTTTPKGIHLMKVRYFLESIGYEISEFKNLNKHIYNLGKLIAYNKLDLEQISRRVGMPGSDELLRVLHGYRSLSIGRTSLVKMICGEYGDILVNLNKNKPPQIIKPKETEIKIEPIEKVEEILIATSKTEASNKYDSVVKMLQGVDGLVSLLMPKFEALLGEETKPEERQKFRELATRQLVFDLANRFFNFTKMLNALCSEKAREISEKNRRKNVR